LQLSELLAGDVKESRSDHPTRDLQTATDRTWSHTLCGPRYLGYSLPQRDVEEQLAERGPQVDHPTDWRWVQYFGNELEQRLRQHNSRQEDLWTVDSLEASGRFRRRITGRRRWRRW